MFKFSTKANRKYKCSALYQSPTFAKPMLPVVLSRLSLCLFMFVVSWCVGLVALLDFLAWLCALKKNTNVPPNALAIVCCIL
jgi:hypothetical protein